MHGDQQRRRCAPGFSLLESLVVLAVLGLITAIVAPALVQRSFGSREEQAMRGLRDSLFAARLEAVRSASSVSAEIRLRDGDLVLQWGGNTSEWPGVGFSTADFDGAPTDEFDVRFDARGRADQRGIRFHAESAGTMWEIAFEGVTGRPRLRQVEEQAE